MAIVFEETSAGLYDLKQDGRALEYDVEPWDLEGALRRRRIQNRLVYVMDLSGRMTLLPQKRRR